MLTVRLHANDGPVTFTGSLHNQFPRALADISDDRHNRVLILTGTGDRFMTDIDGESLGDITQPASWDPIVWEGRKVIERLDDRPMPFIAAINGPATVHSEYVLRADITIASERLLSRHRSSHDRRSVELRLTDAGTELIPALAACSQHTNEQFLAGLTKQDRASLIATLKEILDLLVRVKQLLPTQCRVQERLERSAENPCKRDGQVGLDLGGTRYPLAEQEWRIERAIEHSERIGSRVAPGFFLDVLNKKRA